MGDDLESDDDYLTKISHNNDSENDDKKGLFGISNKRSRTDSIQAEEIITNKKKAKAKNKSISKIDHTIPSGKRKLLLTAARGIGQESSDVQAAFLWTCYTHALGGTDGGEKFKSSSFLSWKDKVQLNRGAWNNEERDIKYPFVLKEAIAAKSSMKKLKEWNTKKSPMILILCISARRCVAVLKAISSLKIRCAKLFAKHMDLEDQVAQLSSTPFPVGVGTPNRLSKLCHDGALSLQSTELIFIDGHEDNKSFTVCTLNDTASELAKFIHEQVQPQILERPHKIQFVMC